MIMITVCLYDLLYMMPASERLREKSSVDLWNPNTDVIMITVCLYDLLYTMPASERLCEKSSVDLWNPNTDVIMITVCLYDRHFINFKTGEMKIHITL